MTADEAILISSLLSYIIFVIFFGLFIKKFPSYPMQGVILSFIPGFFITVTLVFITSPNLSIVLISIFLYTLLSLFYIFGIYLNIDSSLHVRILQEVSIAGRKGLTYKDLLRVYNKKIILNKRIAWMISSGEIGKKGDILYRKSRFSTLLFREMTILLLKKLYGT